jgi:hypothetical protein
VKQAEVLGDRVRRPNLERPQRVVRDVEHGLTLEMHDTATDRRLVDTKDALRAQLDAGSVAENDDGALTSRGAKLPNRRLGCLPRLCRAVARLELSAADERDRTRGDERGRAHDETRNSVRWVFLPMKFRAY